MPDPIPEGYISLHEAWEAYVRAWPGHPVGEYLCQPFARRELDAFVRLPGHHENLRFVFQGDDYEERAFETPLRLTRGTAWESFEARTPFVDEADFRRWLSQACEAEQKRLDRDFDPLKEPLWTMMMAVAWVQHRRVKHILPHWGKYRSAHGGNGALPMAPALLAYDLGDGLRDLTAALEAGLVKGMAIDQETMEPKEIPLLEWPYLQLSFDSNFVERLDRKGSHGQNVRYRDLVFRTADIVGFWEPIGQDEVDKSEMEQLQAQKSQRRSPGKERVQPVLQHLYPQGIPERSDMSDTELVMIVSAYMDAEAKASPGLKSRAPSRDTVLRAANRK